ncbi:helix-turn-helix transcriptional regulator [uncultured Maritimibacter sp.]|jgi:DNA-binding transcriptional ArsR family regulator|uniref:ArsR/SmtB family transcription factor n=1 Tax=uncultured Maritimibacter sp. TaxID=991866 RepID=UPI000A48F2A2|nr:metalloregulator ArsR/SmtB family transcription factor [uncultured Maritimibacter sp.]
MTKYEPDLDRTFFALADPTRRAIIGLLCAGPKTVSDLAEPFDIALPSLLKHVQLLEKAGIVTSEKRGRVRTCSVDTDALRATDRWLQAHITEWETRLERMEAHIQRMKENEQ